MCGSFMGFALQVKEIMHELEAERIVNLFASSYLVSLYVHTLSFLT